MPERNIAADDDGRRLDRVLRAAFPDVPPGAIAAAIRKRRIRLDGLACAVNTRVQQGQVLTYPDWTHTGESRNTPDGARGSTVRREGETILIGPRRIPIVSRSDHWIAINKPAGLASYGAGGIDGDLRELAAREGWWRESLSFRPGPVHRLDFGTSGVQLFSLSADGARILTEAFRRRRTYKLYLALVSGAVVAPMAIDRRLAYDRAGRIALVERNDSPAVGFRSAVTQVTPVAVAPNGRTTLVLARPESGRTHQIRAHLSSAGHPLVGDRKYAGPSWSEIGVSRGYAPGDIAGELFILHALALAIEGDGLMIDRSLLLTAPLAPDARRIVHDAAGDPESVTAAVHDYLTATCTACPANATIRV